MLKYVYIMTYPENSGVKKVILSIASCPMDTIMLEEDAWENRALWGEKVLSEIQ